MSRFLYREMTADRPSITSFDQLDANKTGRTDTSGGVASEKDIRNEINSIEGLTNAQKNQIIESLKNKIITINQLRNFVNNLKNNLARINSSQLLSNDKIKTINTLITRIITEFNKISTGEVITDQIISKALDIADIYTETSQRVDDITINYLNGNLTEEQALTELNRTPNLPSNFNAKEYLKMLKNNQREAAVEYKTRIFTAYGNQLVSAGLMSASRLSTIINNSLTRFVSANVISEDFKNQLASRMTEIIGYTVGTLATKSSNVSEGAASNSLLWQIMNGISSGVNRLFSSAASNTQQETVGEVLENAQREIRELERQIEDNAVEAGQEFRTTIQRNIERNKQQIAHLERILQSNIASGNEQTRQIINNLKNAITALERQLSKSSLNTRELNNIAQQLRNIDNNITLYRANETATVETNTENGNSQLIKRALQELVTRYNAAIQSNNQEEANRLVKDMENLLRAANTVRNIETAVEKAGSGTALQASVELAKTESDLVIVANILRRLSFAGEIATQLRRIEQEAVKANHKKEEMLSLASRTSGNDPRRRALIAKIRGIPLDNTAALDAVKQELGQLDQEAGQRFIAEMMNKLSSGLITPEEAKKILTIALQGGIQVPPELKRFAQKATEMEELLAGAVSNSGSNPGRVRELLAQLNSMPEALKNYAMNRLQQVAPELLTTSGNPDNKYTGSASAA